MKSGILFEITVESQRSRTEIYYWMVYFILPEFTPEQQILKKKSS